MGKAAILVIWGTFFFPKNYRKEENKMSI